MKLIDWFNGKAKEKPAETAEELSDILRTIRLAKLEVLKMEAQLEYIGSMRKRD